MRTVADQDWTDTLLERLGRTRTRKEIEPYEVTARISRVALHVSRRQDAVFGRFGLNRGEVGVLAALQLAGDGRQLSPTQLFKGLMLSSAGITTRLDRLEKRGYVKRSRHPNDRRGVLVTLTESGRKVLEQAVTEEARGEPEMLRGLTAVERRTLASLLKKLLSGLEPAGG
jgi:DNA-binding MarR family transcriptional regulator